MDDTDSVRNCYLINMIKKRKTELLYAESLSVLNGLSAAQSNHDRA
jgi:hypothetical protein